MSTAPPPTHTHTDAQRKQLEACKSPSQQNISNQIFSACLLRRCFAKTTERQGVVVIKEAALQLEELCSGPRVGECPALVCVPLLLTQGRCSLPARDGFPSHPYKRWECA